LRIAKFLLLGLVAFAVASALAVYLYGRFAAQARGPASTTLPVEMATTPLDRVFAVGRGGTGGWRAAVRLGL